MGTIRPQDDAHSATARGRIFLGIGSICLAATGIGSVVDILTAAELGLNVLLIAGGVASILVVLGLMEEKLIFRGHRATAIAMTALLTLGGGVLGAGIRGALSGADPVPGRASCDFKSENAPPGSYVTPSPGRIDAIGVSFCAVDLTDGRSVKDRYTLAGAVLGATPDGKELALVEQPDPKTCDTKGNPGPGGYFLKRRLNFVNGKAVWRIDEQLPYKESSSVRRIFYYVLAPPSAIDALQRDNDEKRGGPFYGGMKAPPESFEKISLFPFTPGVTKEC